MPINLLELVLLVYQELGKVHLLKPLGNTITASGKRVAVLAIDPSSSLTKGSILGDKTRMEELVKDENAYIRPSASGEIA